MQGYNSISHKDPFQLGKELNKVICSSAMMTFAAARHPRSAWGAVAVTNRDVGVCQRCFIVVYHK